MRLMQFKEFVWPNNPTRCTLKMQRKTATHKYPGESFVLEDLGEEQRILTGEGVFFGPGAYLYMNGLLQTFEDSGPGQLIHPVVELQQAIFSELSFLEEPREDYVAYSFTFLEDGGKRSPLSYGTGFVENPYVTAEGEDLWQIAERYETTVAALLEKNSQIANPSYLTAGSQVVLA